ncbi:MAG: polymerase sigma factor SigW [Planctomycetota bacterium]|jgi:RNA polymerase sigma-70 factor (ECF subfamily)
MPKDDRDPSIDRAQDESRGGGASESFAGGASRRATGRAVSGGEDSREGMPAEDNSGELERLLRLAAGGDSSAWRAIVALYAPRVFGIVRAQCRDDELSEEIVQSTFCTLAAKIASYVESGRFESWLFRIAMNRLRDEMRRRSRQARSSTDEAFVGMPDTRERGGRGLAPEVRTKLELALARLSESDREIIDLRHTGGLSFKALSDYYDEPVGTLLARHHRALKKLKAILEDLGVDGTDVGGGSATPTPTPTSRRGEGAT